MDRNGADIEERTGGGGPPARREIADPPSRLAADRASAGTEADRVAPRLVAIANFLRWYHDHTVVGLENIPATGSALLVHNHSFATYDVFMLGAAIYEDRWRLVRGLG